VNIPSIPQETPQQRTDREAVNAFMARLETSIQSLRDELTQARSNGASQEQIEVLAKHLSGISGQPERVSETQVERVRTATFIDAEGKSFTFESRIVDPNEPDDDEDEQEDDA